MYSSDSQLATKSAAHARFKSCTSAIAHRFRVPNNTNLSVCTLCASKAPVYDVLCTVFAAPQTATKLDGQRRGLGDAYVLAVPSPTEYAVPSSGSGDHPQQYYLHQFCTGTVQGACAASHALRLSRKAFFPNLFFWANLFLGQSFFGAKVCESEAQRACIVFKYAC